ncbi:A/G-specific adenine glycosylase [Plasmodium inui San Antonio 1]|uniref:A/G-specific adenine glycosylase n=1 Tax=Plasmodium inui San Antonio 1 TaxID=1237626 RepID=W7ADL2_9APIC|nr:A/G-specific adenine glycosylase [Plasmodium inui San Antonio 1]EUD67144.1 A/G-specific adenine glycosylase [Plasmodium inui San Antonio 1]
MKHVKKEESPPKGREDVEPEYHYDFVRMHSSDIKKDLLDWYHKYRRKLPWRNDEPPYTTTVDVYEGSPQRDIRSYFCKKGDEQISRNSANREHGTRVITKGRQKEQEELPLREIKLVKNECVVKSSPVQKDSPAQKNPSEECEGQPSNELEATDGDCLTTPIRNTQAEVKKEDDSLPPNEKQQLSLRGYQICVSEVMLQQTRVSTVLDFYLKWMNRWGTIFELNECDILDVFKEWKGLGYYHRVKNLVACCKQVVEKYDGVFPNDLKLLKQLPGIGDYTSKAICIHLYNIKDICLDTNVIRILSRITDTINYTYSSILAKHCERVSQILCEEDSNYSEFSQALMDLGSSICNNSPQCSQCPLNKHCLIYLKKKNKCNSNKRDSSFYMDHPDGCKLCLEDRNVEIKYVPLTRKKKKPEKVCLALIVKRSCSPRRERTSITSKVEKSSPVKKKITLKVQKGGGNIEADYYLMIKNTKSNLFSMHYLFPHLVLDKFDKKLVPTENVTDRKEEIWIKFKDLESFTHNSLCQNIIDHYKRSVFASRTSLLEFSS